MLPRSGLETPWRGIVSHLPLDLPAPHCEAGFEVRHLRAVSLGWVLFFLFFPVCSVKIVIRQRFVDHQDTDLLEHL